ncbi:hypothetical protein NDU88_002617 [Pleurodeles waltl]|uniref:Uncharacterized protein n=1 Tax=Pleurodeles waltl TaxID=8319 RepID=A0AAV7KV89_PLEWA|nr:hypothetical protein NDU88_002617 [Pleurodeles waltl]
MSGPDARWRSDRATRWRLPGTPGPRRSADRGRHGGPDRTLPIQDEQREERDRQSGRCQEKRPDTAESLREEVRRPGIKSGMEAHPSDTADRDKPAGGS